MTSAVDFWFYFYWWVTKLLKTCLVTIYKSNPSIGFRCVRQCLGVPPERGHDGFLVLIRDQIPLIVTGHRVNRLEWIDEDCMLRCPVISTSLKNLSDVSVGTVVGLVSSYYRYR